MQSVAMNGQSADVPSVPVRVENKLALAGISVDMAKVDQALHAVMEEIDVLGSRFTRFWDQAHLTPKALAAGAVAAGVGAAYYLRRRKQRKADPREDEATSTWIMASLQQSQ